MERIPTHSSELPYSEQKLAELLDVATKELQPGPGYALHLEGIPLPLHTQKSLEAFFGASLDSSGSSIQLQYDEQKDRLVLESLKNTIQGIDGYAELKRTETLGYIPILHVRDKEFGDASRYLTASQVDVLLSEIGVHPLTEIRDVSPVAYTLWKSDLLSKTKGWKLREIVEIPESLTEYGSQQTSLSNEEIVSAERFAVTSKRSLIRSISTFSEDENGYRHVATTNACVELTRSATDTQVLAYTQNTNSTFEHFVLNDVETKVSEPHALPINEDVYLSFKNALEESIALRHSTF